MPKIINLFIRVVDNLGDIGFAAELVRSFEEAYPRKYHFDIWTNEAEKISSFFEKNIELEGAYSIYGIEKIEKKRATISFLLFHHPIPKNYPKCERELFLRIDYLSFDPGWVVHHGKEHIESTETRKIIEIIPSPLTSSGGLIVPTKHLIGKSSLAKRHNLDETKKWVTLFAYEKTLLENLTIEALEDTQILLLGADFSTSAIAFDRNDNSIISLPFLSLIEFSSIIGESAWAIIRGEVSFISTLQIGTPFLWDMYKEIGGFHDEQATQFLDWICADKDYRDMFYRLNGEKDGGIKISEIDRYFYNHQMKNFEHAYSIITEIQKYIDKYHISL